VVKNKNAKTKIQFQIPVQNTVTGNRINIPVLEPEEEEADPHFEMLNSARRCWRAISRDEKGKAATKLLDEKGCSWVLVLFIVEHYCQHFRPLGKREHVKFTKDMRDLNKKIAKFASRVQTWEAEIEKVNSLIENELPIDAATHTPDFGPYQAVLRVARILALPSMMDLTRKKDLIVLLYHLAKLSTGKAHYEELADILQARLNAEPDQTTMDESTLDVNTLTRTVKRFKREHPSSYRKVEKTLRTLVKGAPFSSYKLPPAYLQGTKVAPV